MAKHVEIKYGSNVFVSFLLFSLHHFCSDYDAACIGRILHIRLRRARSVSFSERCTAHCCPLHTNFRYYLFSHFAFLFSISEKLVSERFQVKFITGALKRIRGNRPGLIQNLICFRSICGDGWISVFFSFRFCDVHRIGYRFGTAWPLFARVSKIIYVPVRSLVNAHRFIYLFLQCSLRNCFVRTIFFSLLQIMQVQNHH